ncbi:MAG: 30S ribosomal protein S6 [Alphaproteobacteria bacterium]|tara:strand:- start:139 stop:483 length:345 start_codon:yes stop_codon:yes gene_type:complete
MIYENVFIFSGQLSQKAAEDKLNESLDFIKKSGGKILKKESWGLRDLAYKIKKNSKGYYYMINTECSADVFKDFDVKVKQDASFLRFLNIKIKEVSKESSLLTETQNKGSNYEK